MATEEERQKYLKEVEAQRGEMKKVVENVLMTDSGKKLFRHLHNICGYAISSLTVNAKTGAIDLEATAFNEARRAIYIHLRDLSPRELLREIEYTEEKK